MNELVDRFFFLNNILFYHYILYGAMVITYPYADHLTVEEVDYELELRNYDVGKDLSSKLRLLRRLFKEDQQERRRYKPLCPFEEEIDLIKNQVNRLLKGLQEKPDVKLVSRLRHYYHRVLRAEAETEQGASWRQELLETILDTIEKSKNLQTVETTGNEEKQEAALGGQILSDSEPEKTLKITQNKRDIDNSKVTGTIPKLSNNNELSLNHPSYEDLLRKVAQLEARLEQAEEEKRQQRKRSEGDHLDNNPRRTEYREKERKEAVERNHYERSAGERRFQRMELRNIRNSSDSDEHSVHGARGRRLRNSQRDRWRNEFQAYSRDTGSSDWYGDQANRNARQYRRIEHWKLSFSGDNKSVSVENFLYKLKKIADREGVSDRNLLKDIHLILEGQASDWFFTYVDEFIDWKDFEDRIRYRFGNPNQDQGIRLKIQERKQQRGESFSAFVSEIERLNKMLSRPLSSRRKFEVVWDNMRPHYRSRIATINVQNLDQLTRLNHGIDAADPNLQYSSDSRNQRNVHHIDYSLSDCASDEQEEIDAIRTSTEGRNHRPIVRNTAVESQQKPGQNICWNCRKYGHNWRDCKETKSVFCYGCGNLGRTIRSCQKCAGSTHRMVDGSQGNQ